jgi:hypothetical protein
MKKKVAAGKSQTCRASEWLSHCRNKARSLSIDGETRLRKKPDVPRNKLE